MVNRKTEFNLLPPQLLSKLWCLSFQTHIYMQTKFDRFGNFLFFDSIMNTDLCLSIGIFMQISNNLLFLEKGR